MENKRRSLPDDAGEHSAIKKSRLNDDDIEFPSKTIDIQSEIVDFASKNIDSQSEIVDFRSKTIDSQSEIVDFRSKTVDIKADFFTICSSLHGKHVLPKTIAVRFPHSGVEEIKTFFLNPNEFIPKSLDPDFVKEELRRFGYNSDLTALTLRESEVGENSFKDERLEQVTTTEVALPELVETIKNFSLTLGTSVTLNFADKQSKQFFLLRLKSKAQTLIDSVEKIVIEGEAGEPLTEELFAEFSEEDDESDLVQVFVDAVFVTYENEEMLR